MNKEQGGAFATRRQWLGGAALWALSVAAVGCSDKKPRVQALPAGSTVLALGDSLTWGTGAPSGASYPAQLAQATGWNVVNAGVAGNTAAQAFARLPDLLQTHQPSLVIVSLGGNDFLQRKSASDTQATLRQTVLAIREHGAQVLLVGVPTLNLQAALGSLSDHPLYQTLADELSVPLHSGGWAQVLSQADWRADAVHPNAQGYTAYTEDLVKHLRSAGYLAGA